MVSLHPYLTWSGSVKDLPPDEQLGGFTLDVRTEQEANKAIAMLIQMTTPKEKQEDDNNNDDDDDRTSVFLKISPMI
jgi:hypothetical protein